LIRSPGGAKFRCGESEIRRSSEGPGAPGWQGARVSDSSAIAIRSNAATVDAPGHESRRISDSPHQEKGAIAQLGERLLCKRNSANGMR